MQTNDWAEKKGRYNQKICNGHLFKYSKSLLQKIKTKNPWQLLKTHYYHFLLVSSKTPTSSRNGKSLVRFLNGWQERRREQNPSFYSHKERCHSQEHLPHQQSTITAVRWKWRNPWSRNLDRRSPPWLSRYVDSPEYQ